MSAYELRGKVALGHRSVLARRLTPDQAAAALVDGIAARPQDQALDPKSR